MTGLVRKAMLFAVCGLLTTGVAMAAVPDPANSECHNVGAEGLGLFCGPGDSNFSIYVVGDNGVVADVDGLFCVTVRNFSNVPIENSEVVLDFSECLDVQLCADQLDPDAQVFCASKTIHKLTDASGVACFRVRGKSKAAAYPNCGSDIKDCVKIYADTQLLCSADALTFDLINNPGDGLNTSDLSEFGKLLLLCPGDPVRANYDCTNKILNSTDLSIFGIVFLKPPQGSGSNCAGIKDPAGPKCP